MKLLPATSRLVMLVSISLLAALAIPARATVVDLTSVKDNTLVEDPLGNSNGAGDGFYAGRTGTSGNFSLRRGLVRFDLSSIPSGSVINSATLTLELAMSNSLAHAVTLHRVNADWGEAGSSGGGSGSAAQTGDATWQHRFFNTQSWAAAGGDFVAAASASLPVVDVGLYSWTGAGLTADVSFWLANPTSNFGWLVKGNEGANQTSKKFFSREVISPGNKPKLTVDYTASTGVGPGPSAGKVEFSAPWPAPAHGSVHLDYTLPRAARVSLSIHDPMGRLVRRLVAGVSEGAGRRVVEWDGRTGSGARAESGVYLASLVVDGEPHQRRFALLK